jgi:hypothetical protein
MAECGRSPDMQSWKNQLEVTGCFEAPVIPFILFEEFETCR